MRNKRDDARLRKLSRFHERRKVYLANFYIFDEEDWVFTRQGKRLEFSILSSPDKPHRNHSHRTPGTSCLTKAAYAEKYPEKSDEEIHEEWGAILGKRRGGKIARLMEYFDTIANTPRHFVSLAVDRTQRPFTSAKEEIRVFEKFRRALMRNHTNSWFSYKVEYDGGLYLHLHMIGTLSRTPRRCSSPAQAGRLIKALWDSANGFTWEKSTKVQAFKEADCGYLTKPRKRNNDMHCVELLGRSRMVGLIGLQNVRFHETETVQLTDDEKAEYFQELKKYWLQEGRSLRSFNRQVRDSAGGNLARIPPDVATEALKKVTRKKWR